MNVRFPLDVLLLLVLVPAHTHLDGVDFLLVFPLLFYVLLAMWRPLVALPALPQNFNTVRLSFLLRLMLLFIIIVGAAIVPTLDNIAFRLGTAIDDEGYSPAYAQMHDGAVQIEAALRYLDQGRNPYVADYDDTALRYYGFSGLSDTVTNPALDYLVYLPGYLLSSFPVFKLLDAYGVYDQRLVYLAAYVVLLLLLPLLVEAPSRKLSLLAAVGLNPLLTGPVIIGMNDVVVLLLLATTTLALLRQRPYLSSLLLGLAVGFKHSAWFIAPFVLAAIYGMFPDRRRLRRTARATFIVLLTALVIIGPFLLWDPQAFLTDTLSYPGGNVPNNYPIRGYTIGTLLVGAGVIGSPLDSFPFWTLQLLFGTPLLLLLLKFQRKHNQIGLMLVCAGIFIFGMGFVSRFFQSNYLGFVTMLVTMGLLLEAGEESRRPLRAR